MHQHQGHSKISEPQVCIVDKIPNLVCGFPSQGLKKKIGGGGGGKVHDPFTLQTYWTMTSCLSFMKLWTRVFLVVGSFRPGLDILIIFSLAFCST